MQPLKRHAPADLEGERLIDKRRFCELLSISAATFERMLAAGKLPEPIRLSSQCHRWRQSVVQLWIEQGCPAPEPKRSGSRR